MFQRIFAAEFNAAKVQFSCKDTAEPAVLTPGGAVLTLVFCTGALLERQGCGNGTVHARLADPTGAFSLQADPHLTDARTILCSLDTPCFATVIGKPFLAGTGQSARGILKVLDIRATDKYTRDIWVLRTAEATLNRLERINEILRSGREDPLIRALVTSYSLGPERLCSLAEIVRVAVQSVQIKNPPVQSECSPESVILAIIKEHGGKTGITIEEITRRAANLGFSTQDVITAVEALCREDECYQPSKGIFKLL